MLLDVRMGQMTGLELQQRLIDTGIDWPVIFLSGHGDLEMAVETMMKGAVCFLQKPVRREKLKEALDRATALSETKANQRQAAYDALSSREKQLVKLAAQGVAMRAASRNRSTHRRISQGKRHAKTRRAHRNRIGRGSQRSKSLTKIAVKR